MKYLLLLTLVISQLSFAQTSDPDGTEGYDPLIIPDFQILLPAPGKLKTYIPDRRGTCAVFAIQWKESDPLSLMFNIISPNNTIKNEVETLRILPDQSLMVYSRACGKLSGYQYKIVRNADGGKTANIACQGNPVKGEGSNRISVTVNRNQYLTSFKMDARHGWYNSFYKAQLDCKF